MTRLEVATAAIVRQHGEEMKAFLRGEIEAGAWRPEAYARAVLADLQLDPSEEAA